MVLHRSTHEPGCRTLHPARTAAALDLSRFPQPRFQFLVLQRTGLAPDHGDAQRRRRAVEHNRCDPGGETGDGHKEAQKSQNASLRFLCLFVAYSELLLNDNAACNPIMLNSAPPALSVTMV